MFASIYAVLVAYIKLHCPIPAEQVACGQGKPLNIGHDGDVIMQWHEIDIHVKTKR